MTRQPYNHDIIAVGASAGGVETLKQLAADLPADLPAAVFIVLHVGSSSYLAPILDRVGSLPAVQAESGQPIERRRIYVAPPGVHMLLHDHHVLLRRGPRENLSRPAIDPLFRSAACTFGGRVVGVVLSGALDDGTAGLRAIKRCGGLAVVQDPADAMVSDMPRSALAHVAVDHCLPLAEMGALLVRLAGEPVGQTPDIPLEIRLETAIAAQEHSSMKSVDRLGEPSGFTCPDCHGSLWEIADGDMLRYRCHVGHAFTAETMLAAQGEDMEQTLWSLLRSHQERAELLRRMARHEQARKGRALAERLEERAREYDQDAELIEQMLRGRTVLPAEQEMSDEIAGG